MVAKYHQEQDQKEQKAVKEEAQKLKRIAGQVAKQVKEFWANIEKVYTINYCLHTFSSFFPPPLLHNIFYQFSRIEQFIL